MKGRGRKTKDDKRKERKERKGKEPWEKKGDVSNVVFPTGTAIFGKKLYIYYGAADTRIAVASVDLSGLLTELLKNK